MCPEQKFTVDLEEAIFNWCWFGASISLFVCHVAHHTSLLTQTNINSTDVALIQLFGRKISLGLVSYTVDATKARSL